MYALKTVKMSKFFMNGHVMDIRLHITDVLMAETIILCT
jgi:hypothetical protein